MRPSRESVLKIILNVTESCSTCCSIIRRCASNRPFTSPGIPSSMALGVRGGKIECPNHIIGWLYVKSCIFSSRQVCHRKQYFLGGLYILHEKKVIHTESTVRTEDCIVCAPLWDTPTELHLLKGLNSFFVPPLATVDCDHGCVGEFVRSNMLLPHLIHQCLCNLAACTMVIRLSPS